MECFLPVPQFAPPKFGYHDTEPVSPTWAIKLCKKNKLKQNFPMDLPFLSDSWWSWCHTRIWALWFLHQHHKLRWKSCSSQPLPESLSGRSREMFPLYPTAQECLLCRIALAALLGTTLGLEINPSLGCSVPRGALGFCPSTG